MRKRIRFRAVEVHIGLKMPRIRQGQRSCPDSEIKIRIRLYRGVVAIPGELDEKYLRRIPCSLGLRRDIDAHGRIIRRVYAR